jgi:hypothetical protein
MRTIALLSISGLLCAQTARAAILAICGDTANHAAIGSTMVRPPVRHPCPEWQ